MDATSELILREREIYYVYRYLLPTTLVYTVLGRYILRPYSL